MDFIISLHHIHKQHDSIWVIFDRVTKSARFLTIKTTDLMENYPLYYINQIVRLHGVLFSNISDRGSHLTSDFQMSFKKDLVLWSTLG